MRSAPRTLAAQRVRPDASSLPLDAASATSSCTGSKAPTREEGSTVDHDASSLIGGREPVEIYHPKIPAEVLLRPGPDGQSELRLRTFA